MKKINFFLVCCLFAASMFFVTGCDDKDDPDNPTSSVLDPIGTITSNIGGADFQVIFGNESFNIGWTTPDNFKLAYSGSYNRMSICDLGPMNGLGNITKIPVSGFTVPAQSNYSVACEEGHGYVIKCENMYTGNFVYVRLYVVESIVSTSGGVMGAKIKYQYPFEP
jgi:hypothetical protein